MWRLFKQEVHIPNGYNGTMPNGDPLAPGATFSSFRSQYKDVEKYMEYYDLYYGTKTGKSLENASTTELEEAMKTIELKYHRFWHAGDILMALGTMTELYPDLEVDRNDDGEDEDEAKLKVESSIEVEVGKTETITSNVTGSKFESADSTVATVDPSTGVVTGVKEGTTTITVTTPAGQTATVTVTVTDEISTVPTGSLNPDDLLYGDVDLNELLQVADVVTLAKYSLSDVVYPLGKGDDETFAKAWEQSNVEHDDDVNTSDLSKLVEFHLQTVKQSELGPQ
jgi:hypothetical protein